VHSNTLATTTLNEEKCAHDYIDDRYTPKIRCQTQRRRHPRCHSPRRRCRLIVLSPTQLHLSTPHRCRHLAVVWHVSRINMSLDDQQQVPCALGSERPASLDNDTHIPPFTMTAAFTPVSVLFDAMPECLDEDPLFQTSVSWLTCRWKQQPRQTLTAIPADPVADREALSQTLILVIVMDN